MLSSQPYRLYHRSFHHHPRNCTRFSSTAHWATAINYTSTHFIIIQMGKKGTHFECVSLALKTKNATSYSISNNSSNSYCAVSSMYRSLSFYQVLAVKKLKTFPMEFMGKIKASMVVQHFLFSCWEEMLGRSGLSLLSDVLGRPMAQGTQHFLR